MANKSITVGITAHSALTLMQATREPGLSLNGIQGGDEFVANFSLTSKGEPAPSDTVIELHSDGTWSARMGAPL